jgi:acetoin utilization deacetylase AcuC-like enzyme
MPTGSRDGEYLEALDRVALPIIEQFDPELLIVSAGQDGHAADPLSGQLISARGFESMARRAADLTRRLEIGLVLVHEGGYNVSTLPTLDRSIVSGLGGFEVAEPDIFVPEDAPAPGAWPERLREVIDAQRPFWEALR